MSLTSDPLAIKLLSSGTMATLMRKSAKFLLYQCSDSWWVDKTQFHFWWFSQTGTWTRWQDCWNDYIRLLDRWSGSPRCSYRGETDVRWQSREYVVGSSFDPTWPHWNGQDVIDGRLATLGAVYCKSGMADGFPPDEVIAACIGYVPVTATYDKRPNPGSILGYDIVNWRYVYHDVFGKPETAVPVRSLPGHVYAKAWSDYDRIEDWDAEPRAKRLRRRLTPVVCE